MPNCCAKFDYMNCVVKDVITSKRLEKGLENRVVEITSEYTLARMALEKILLSISFAPVIHTCFFLQYAFPGNLHLYIICIYKSIVKFLVSCKIEDNS